MFGKCGQKCVIQLPELVHDIHEGRLQELLDSLCHHRTDTLVRLHAGNHLTEQGIELRQLEIPVGDLLHHRLLPGKGAAGIYKVYGVVGMTQVALIRISLFGLAALHRALPHHLTAVEEHPCLFIEKLRRGHLFKIAKVIQLLYKLMGDLLVLGRCIPKGRGTEKVKAYEIVIKGLLLGIVIALYIVTDRALKPRLTGLAVALSNG